MSNFVFDDTALPTGKTDSRPWVGPASEAITAAEWNTVMAALGDLRANTRGVVRDARDYGVSTDATPEENTAALQAAIDDLPKGYASPAGYMAGGTILLPEGLIKVSDQVIMYGWWGVTLKGAGKTATTLMAWGTGWAAKPVILMQKCEHCTIQDMWISCDGTDAAPSEAIYLSSDAASPGHAGSLVSISSRNAIRNIKIGAQAGSLEFNYGIRCGGSVDANNDFHLLDNVEISAVTRGFLVEQTQSVEHVLSSCFIIGPDIAVDAGSVTIIGGGFGNCSTADFGLGPGQGAGGGFRVYGSTSEGSDRILITNNSLGAAHNVLIKGMRWSADALNADGYMIDYRRAGIITVENCRFDSSVASGVPKIAIRSSVYAPGRVCNNYWNHNGADMIESPVELYSYVAGVGYPGGTHGVEVSGNLYQGSIGGVSANWRPEFEGARIPASHLAALPTRGYWIRGQRVENTAPTPGGFASWVCTTEGFLCPAWADTHNYDLGEKASNDSGKVYEVITAGQSAGSGGPTGDTPPACEDILDGTVHWKYVGVLAVFEESNKIRSVSGVESFDNSISLPKTSGKGIEIEGTFGYRDIIGDVSPKSAPPNAPTLAAFRGGSVKAWFFSAGDTAQMLFHIPHDYVPGSDLFLHLHWAHNGTAISGQLVATFGVTYAKGHDQAAFPAEVAPVLTVSTPDIATIPQYRHRIDELQLSAASPSGTQIDTDNIEPDGLLLVSLVATTIPTITGGSTDEPVFLTCDLHYQSTNVGTKNKAPNFYA